MQAAAARAGMHSCNLTALTNLDMMPLDPHLQSSVLLADCMFFHPFPSHVLLSGCLGWMIRASSM